MGQENFAKGSALQFTLREMTRELRNPALWIGLLAVGVILGLAGPFGTEAVMRTLPRLGYWILVVAVTYCSGSFVATWAAEAAQRRRAPKWPAVVLSGIVAGMVISAELILLNIAIFGPAGASRDLVFALVGNVVVISVIVSCAFVAISDRMMPPAPPPNARPAHDLPAILQRLPVDKRAALVSISVQDHYVHVVTLAGSNMVLMRLSDAIKETAPEPGLQIHRSHWVATDQVAAIRREGQKAVVTLTDGRDLPVSRTYVPALRQAGLLPR